MVKKVSKKQPKKPAAAAVRTRKLTKKQQKAKAKAQAQKQTPIPGSFSLTKQVFITLKKFWKPLGGIFLVYLVLNVIFATGVISSLNNEASNLASSHGFSKAVSGFGSLIGSSANSGSSGASVAQSIILVVASLAIIWALRQLLSGEPVKVKQAYYHSMAPLIPFLLVIGVIILQLLPVTLGSTVLALILSSALVSSGLITGIFVILLAFLAIWSAYMLSSSVFALYIVTLPDMQPRQALRSAKSLVKYRRWQLMRRLLFLPICTLLLMAIIIVPLILVASFSVAIAFFVLSMLALLLVHTYLYSLYRGLIA